MYLHLSISGAQFHVIEQLLSTSQSSIIDLSVMLTNTFEERPLLTDFELSKISSIALAMCSSSILRFLLSKSNGATLKSLCCSEILENDECTPEMIELLRKFTKLEDVNLPEPYFSCLEPALLSIMTDVRLTGYELILDDALLPKLMSCKRLTYLRSNSIKSITVENWITRLFNACPNLTEIDMPKAILHSSLDLSDLLSHDEVRGLRLHYSNLTSEYRHSLLNKLPYLKEFDVSGIPLGQYPGLIQSINNYVKDIHELRRVGVEVTHYKDEEDFIISDCEFLSPQISECVLKVEGSSMTFEELPLLVITSVVNRGDSRVNIGRESFNSHTFFPASYTSRLSSETELDFPCKSFITDVAMDLFPSVVSRIKGISKEQREYLLEIVSDDSIPPSDAAKILVGLYEYLSWNIEVSNFDSQ